jgi:hypothetical protein
VTGLNNFGTAVGLNSTTNNGARMTLMLAFYQIGGVFSPVSNPSTPLAATGKYPPVDDPSGVSTTAAAINNTGRSG